MTLRWYGDEVKRDMAAIAADALFDAAEFVLEEANRTVPIDEGTLQRSGATDVDRQALVAVVSYDTPYAARQHEEMTYRHAAGRRAKWLELTLQEQSAAIDRFIAARMRGAF